MLHPCYPVLSHVIPYVVPYVPCTGLLLGTWPGPRGELQARPRRGSKCFDLIPMEQMQRYEWHMNDICRHVKPWSHLGSSWIILVYFLGIFSKKLQISQISCSFAPTISSKRCSHTELNNLNRLSLIRLCDFAIQYDSIPSIDFVKAKNFRPSHSLSSTFVSTDFRPRRAPCLRRCDSRWTASRSPF